MNKNKETDVTKLNPKYAAITIGTLLAFFVRGIPLLAITESRVQSPLHLLKG